MNLSLILTQRCNLFCEHCYLPSIKHNKSLKDELSFEDFEFALQLISSQFSDQIDEIYVSGGEFILLSYGDKVIETIKHYFSKNKIYAYTNGIHFKNNKDLIQKVQPDVYHVSIDLWHNNVGQDGYSSIADYFVSLKENKLIKELIFHWTRQDNDNDVFDNFFNKYGSYDQIVIEDRSLNTTTGRAKQFPDPNYRDSEVWRSCDLGDHILLKYDGFLYSCHYAIPVSSMGRFKENRMKIKMNKIQESNLNRIYNKQTYNDFYRFVCDKHDIVWSKNRCLLCEKFTNENINIFDEADTFVKKTNVNINKIID